MGHLSSGAPWDTLAIDYMGPLPETANGNKYILVMTDHFTKYVEVVAVPNQRAEDCALGIANDFVAAGVHPRPFIVTKGGHLRVVSSKSSVVSWR